MGKTKKKTVQKLNKKDKFSAYFSKEEGHMIKQWIALTRTTKSQFTRDAIISLVNVLNQRMKESQNAQKAQQDSGQNQGSPEPSTGVDSKTGDTSNLQGEMGDKLDSSGQLHQESK